MSTLRLGSNSISPGQSQSFVHLFTGGYTYNIKITPVLERYLSQEDDNEDLVSLQEYSRIYGEYEKTFQELHLKVYTEKGQKVADDIGNFGVQCYLNIFPGEPLKLKVVVSRDMMPSSRSNDTIEYQVTLHFSQI